MTEAQVARIEWLARLGYPVETRRNIKHGCVIVRVARRLVSGVLFITIWPDGTHAKAGVTDESKWIGATR